MRLPASRALAAQLGVSRGVVTDAYEQLTAEGWLAARRGAGTVVAAAPRRGAGAGGGRRAARAVRFDFTPTTPDVSLFPRRQWARAVARAAAEAPDAELDYGSGFGSLALREALAGYLGRVRATAAAPAQIVVCAGYSQATRLIFAVLAERGVRRVALRGPVAVATTGTPRRARASRPCRSRSTATGCGSTRSRPPAPTAVVRDAEPPVPDRRGDGAGAPPRAARVGARRASG